MADKYGFTITTTDEASGKLQKIQVQINNTVNVAQNAGQEISKSLENAGHGANVLEQQFSHIGSAIAGAFALHGIKEFASHILEVTQEFEGFDNRIKFSSNSIIDAGENMAFLKKQVDTLKLPTKEIYEGFTDLQTGMAGTAIQGEKLRTLFKGITEYASVIHLPKAQLERSLYDLKEIGEVGLKGMPVRSLQQQFSGIKKIVKQTFGKSIEELKGNITGEEFLSKLGEGLQKEAERGAGLDNWKNSLQARNQDFSNSVTNLMLELGDKLRPVFTGIFSSATDSIKSVTQFVKGIDLSSLNKWGKTLAEVALAFGVLKVATIGYNGALAMYNTLEELAIWRTLALESGQKGLAATTTALNETFVGLGATLATLGTGAAVFGLIKIAEYFNNIADAANKAADAKGNFSKTDEAAKSLQDRFKDVQLSYDSFTRDLQSGDKSVVEDAKERAGKFLGDLPTTINDYKKSISELKTTQQEQFKELKSANVYDTDQTQDFGVEPAIGGGNTKIFSAYGKELADRTEKTKKDLDENNKQLAALTKMLDAIKKLGIKGSAAGTGSKEGTAADSIGILSGANGGLDKANIINIKVDTLQNIEKITSMEDWKKASQEAIDTMIRMFNNISNGSAATV